MNDVLGNALSDHYKIISRANRGGNDRLYTSSTAKLWVHHRLRDNKEEPREVMPVDVFFRDMEAMPELEWVALQQCRGRILDIGAGAGSHALALQRMGQDITAMDISPQAVAIMKARGVKNVIEEDFFRLAPGKAYDTLLLLMNGIGISGTIDGLRQLLAKARTLLQPGGQLIFDSSDVAYLYNGKPPVMEGYYGEILHQYEYRGQRSDWFKWLFIDKRTLKTIAAKEGWLVSLLYQDPWDQYLVRCRLR